MEFAFVDVALKAISFKSLQDLSHVFLVFFKAVAEYQDIVHVGAYEVVQILLKNVVNVVLPGCRCVGEAKFITRDSKSLNRVRNAVFHSSPAAIRSLLKAAIISSFVK